ncbi:MAG: outer membrane beta-barrel protein [Bdellovibrionaceae bacterium]|nr:outer membrane beta-barrel protein [Pseudobdellovibrionaceae bacterium]
MFKIRWILKCVFIGLLCFSASASAGLRWERFVGVDLYTGPTLVTGQFSDQKNPNSYGFSLNVFLQSLQDVDFPSYMSIGNYNFSMVSRDPSFPFPLDQSVHFSTNFMSIMASVYSTHNWGLYVGVGYSIISLLNEDKEKFVQRYGSEQYEFQARYRINDRWGVNYRTQWQQINQFQSGTFSFIEMWSHFLGVSYVVF